MPKITDLETATSPANDDYFIISGATNGTRNILTTNVINTNLADTSLSNLTVAGKTVIPNMAMPSSSYINLTLGVDGSTYTAPADGYLAISKVTNANNQHISLTGVFTCTTMTPASGASCRVWMPIRSGETITYNYSAAGATNYFKFIYAEGSKI